MGFGSCSEQEERQCSSENMRHGLCGAVKLRGGEGIFCEHIGGENYSGNR